MSCTMLQRSEEALEEVLYNSVKEDMVEENSVSWGSGCLSRCQDRHSVYSFLHIHPLTSQTPEQDVVDKICCQKHDSCFLYLA